VRIVLTAALLVLAGCDVENDTANEKVTVQYDREKIRQSAADAARTAKGVATGVANVAGDTGRSIKREVGDVDVDVKVSRNKTDEQAN
jgi:hypothetical protein